MPLQGDYLQVRRCGVSVTRCLEDELRINLTYQSSKDFSFTLVTLLHLKGPLSLASPASNIIYPLGKKWPVCIGYWQLKSGLELSQPHLYHSGLLFNSTSWCNSESKIHKEPRWLPVHVLMQTEIHSLPALAKSDKPDKQFESLRKIPQWWRCFLAHTRSTMFFFP